MVRLLVGLLLAGSMSLLAQYQHSVFIRGKAVLENGQPAPVDTIVQLQCVGSGKRETEVKTDGTFDFQFMAANDESRIGPRTYGVTFGVVVDCRIQAQLNGYYSPMGIVAGKDTRGMFDAGTLVLHPKKEAAGGMTVSATSLKAPKEAQKAFQKGRELASKGKWKPAVKEYQAAVAAYPEYAEAWYELGRAQEGQKKGKGARKSYEQALEVDANFLPPALRLAVLEMQEGNWEQVEERTAGVLKMNPYEYPEAYFYNVLANYQLDRLPEAEMMARKALEQSVQNTYPQVVHTFGMVLAALGRLEEAVVEYERFFEIAPDHPDRAVAEEQLAVIKQSM